jgi:hypothetical protein
MTMIPDGAAAGPVLQEAMRELESAIHDARVAFDCISLGELDRAHTSAVTARIAVDAAVTAVQTVLAQAGGGAAPGGLGPRDDLGAER